MSRNLAAPAGPLPCPEDLFAALAARNGTSSRERLLEHVEQCPQCLARIAEAARLPKGNDDDDEDPPPFISIGDVIGNNYRVEELIGSGAMGSVYRAKQIDSDLDVALKVLRPERLSDVNAERRFAREARATASLQSPHAVRTYEVDRLRNGIPFIVMEYLRGADLGAVLAQHQKVPVVDAVRYIIEACDAVGEAHDRAIIHRDIKPANLFLTLEASIKVLDFGLAKNLPIEVPEAGSEATKTNFLLGSPHYMSPEQLRSAKEVDPRADIWSLGATLFHLVAGSPPFSGMNLYLLIGAIMNDSAPALSTRLPDAPLALDVVIAKCLRRDRENRYASCAELASALLEVLDSLTHPADLAEPTRDLTKRVDSGLDRRRAAVTLDATEVPVDIMPIELSGIPTVPMKPFARTMLSAQAPSLPPRPTAHAPVAIASFAEPEDDIDPTLLGGGPPFIVVEESHTSSEPPTLDAQPSSDLPKLYEDDPSSDPKEQHGTMLMSETVDRLLAQEPAKPAVPRVYDDDVDLLPDVTKVMGGSAPHLKAAAPLPAAGRNWNQTVPLAQPLAPPMLPQPAVTLPAPTPQAPPVVALLAPPLTQAPTNRLRNVLLVLIVILLGIAVFTFTFGAVR